MFANDRSEVPADLFGGAGWRTRGWRLVELAERRAF